MLVLSRKQSERIRLGDSIVLTIIRVSGDKVRLGIVSPREVSVHRQEVYDAIHAACYETPLIMHRPNIEQRHSEPYMRYVEVSLGQLLGQIGAQESDVARDGRFTTEGGIRD